MTHIPLVQDAYSSVEIKGAATFNYVNRAVHERDIFIVDEMRRNGELDKLKLHPFGDSSSKAGGCTVS